MKYKEFKTQVLSHAVGQARLFFHVSCLDDIKIEPEQLFRNVVIILVVLTETEDFQSDLVNNRSGSDT